MFNGWAAASGEKRIDFSARVAWFGDILNVEGVRHEAADVAVMTGRQPGHNPVWTGNGDAASY